MPAALVLAAGKSTRIRDVTKGRPKPLLELGGRSLLEWNLLWLAKAGVRRIWINLHYRPERIRCAVGDGSRWGLEVHYSNEDSLLGTAGAWRRLSEHWETTSLVIYGDNLMRFDLERFVAAHARFGTAATVALFDPDVHVNTGIAGSRVQIANQRVTAFHEGARSSAGLVGAGAYLLEPSVEADVPDGFADFGRDVSPALARRGDLSAHLIEPSGFCLGADTPASYRRAQELIRSRSVALV